MEIHFLGACNEVGRSAFIVETNEVRLLLDAGIKIHHHSALPLVGNEKIDAAVISHAHLDHSGYSPALYKHRPLPCYATAPTIPLATLLLEDSEKVALKKNQSLPFSRAEMKQLGKHFTSVPLEEEHEFYDGTSFKLYDAGHIIGSAQVLVKGDKTLLYTGDFKRERTSLHNPAKEPKERVDALLMESTYAGKEHPPRQELEKTFADEVDKAIDAGLTVLIPSFAVGRTQEILMVLRNVDAEVFVDGMGKDVISIMSDFPSYLRDYKALRNAVEKAELVESGAQRRSATKNPGVIVSTSGMLDGGPALSYIQELDKNGKGAVFLTGYQVEGTNGRLLVEQGKIKDMGRLMKIDLPVKQFDFSAHASGSELVEYAEKVSPEKVFCVHGDAGECSLLAEQLKEKGFDAAAPKLGEKAMI